MDFYSVGNSTRGNSFSLIDFVAKQCKLAYVRFQFLFPFSFFSKPKSSIKINKHVFPVNAVNIGQLCSHWPHMILLLGKKRGSPSENMALVFELQHKIVSCQFINLTYTAKFKDVSIGRSIKPGQDVRSNKATED